MRRRGILKGIGGIGAVLTAGQASEPVAAQESSVTIVETNDPVQAGDVLEVVVEVENSTGSDVRPEIRLFVGGDRTVSRTRTIAAGTTETLEFSHRTFPVRQDVEFTVAVEGADDADERVVRVLGIDELDDEDRNPAREVTVAPGTTVLFEVESAVLGEFGGRTHWYLDGGYAGWSRGPWAWAYYDAQGADHWRQTFDSAGTHRVAAAVRGDDENYTARWTIRVADGGAGAPTIESTTPSPGPLERSSGDPVELAVDVADPTGRLDRAIWWLGHADVVLGVSDLDGATDTASLTTDELCHGCPVILWVTNEHGALTEDHRWTPRLGFDGETHVTIVDANDPVEAGGVLEVIAEVENTAGGDVADELELVVGDEVVDSASVTLGAGETRSLTLGYDTYPVEVDVEFPVTVRSDGDRDTRTVEVLTDVGPATVEILETNAPVGAGEFLEVDVEVTNTGEATITEDVHLEAGDVVDDESVTLRPGESAVGSLGYDTYPVEVDVEFPIVVYGEGDRDHRTVQVFADEVPPVSLAILDANDTVEGGEFLAVTVGVENVGDARVTADVDLVVGGDAVATESVTLASGQTRELELGYRTYPVQRDVEFPVTVRSDGVSDERTVAVSGTDGSRVVVESVGTNAPVEAGETLEVTAEVENVGAGATEGPVAVGLLVDETVVDSDEVALEAGESSAVTFAHRTGEGDAGERTITVRTPDDSEQVEVTVEDGSETALELVDYHISGSDPDEEYITLRNTGDVTIDMTGWTIEDEYRVGVNLSPFEFPGGFELEPGEQVTIVSGDGTNTADTVHWEVGNPVWNHEDGDVVTVYDSNGEIVLREPIGPEVGEAEASEEERPEEEAGETAETNEEQAQNDVDADDDETEDGTVDGEEPDDGDEEDDDTNDLENEETTVDGEEGDETDGDQEGDVDGDGSESDGSADETDDDDPGNEEETRDLGNGQEDGDSENGERDENTDERGSESRLSH